VRGAVIVGADPSVRDIFTRGLSCRLRRPDDTEPARQVVIAAVSPHRSGMQVRLKDIDTREAAEALVGALVEVARERMPAPVENEYYDYDIIGLTAVDREERTLGTVVEIIVTGASDVYVITGEQGELLVPATSHAILSVELDRRRIVVEPEAAVRSK